MVPEESDDRLDDIDEYISNAAGEALKGRDLDIFNLRIGLTDGDSHTLQEIGELFGVTRERIRQIANRCVRRIRAKGAAQLR